MKESGLTGSRLSGASVTMAADMSGIVSHSPATDHEGNPWSLPPLTPSLPARRSRPVAAALARALVTAC
jgi:hypothetical protein